MLLTRMLSEMGGKVLFLIVGTGEALIYPTEYCADPGNAYAYTGAEPYTMRTCCNLSEANR
jgi:hypothetical protein